jgi:phenylacetate-CoA ligase
MMGLSGHAGNSGVDVSVVSSVLGAANRYRQLLRSQYWSDEERGSYQRVQLDETLRSAAAIPFYAARLGGSPRAGDLKAIPILRRTEIEELTRSVRSLHPPNFKYSIDSSSGSTGMPAEFMFDASHQRGRFAARVRYLRANGWTPLQRNAWFIHALLGLFDTDDERLMESRLRLRSKFFVATADPAEQIDQLCRFDPVFLYIFPSYLEMVIGRLKHTGRRLSSLRKVFTGAEVLEQPLRQRVKEALGVEIAENYGTTEAFLAWECPEKGFHINAEHVLLEIVDEQGREVEPGQIGRVLVTTLENRLAPLLRYEIGDYAVAAEGRCRCGRTLPLIGKIIGRGMNLFLRGDGRKISPWPFCIVVRQRPEIKQFQIVQTSVTSYLVWLVTDSPFTAEAEQVIKAGFEKIAGIEVSINFQRVPQVQRTPGGKYMTALSQIEGT